MLKFIISWNSLGFLCTSSFTILTEVFPYMGCNSGNWSCGHLKYYRLGFVACVVLSCSTYNILEGLFHFHARDVHVGIPFSILIPGPMECNFEGEQYIPFYWLKCVGPTTK